VGSGNTAAGNTI